MNTLTTSIIVLSVFGLYINLYGNTDLRNPELMTNVSQKMSSSFVSSEMSKTGKISNEVDDIIKELELDPKLIDAAKSVSQKEIDDIINMAKDENITQEKPKQYNEIGQEISKIKEENILNTGKNIKSGSSVRVDGWVRPSLVTKDDETGLPAQNNASYKENYPYKTAEFRMNSGESKILNSQMNLTGRSFKENSNIGTLILPENPDAFDANNTYIRRAADIYKTRIGYENKILPDVRHVNVDKLKEKSEPKLNALDEMSGTFEVKTRPNLIGFKDTVDHMKTHERLYPIDKVAADIKNVARNYNLN